MIDRHPDFPYTDIEEVASVIIKSLPMEESHDKTEKKPQ